MPHLFEDRGLATVGYACGEFEAANNGSGMHYDSGGRLRGQPLTRELVGVLVLREIELHAREPFGLDAQHHHDLRLA